MKDIYSEEPLGIKVYGGVHGNEQAGIHLVKSLSDRPIPGIDAVIANEKASANGVRFIDCEFSTADPNGTGYENQRIAELIELGQSYKVIFDFHNTNKPGSDAVMITPDANKETKMAARWLLGATGIKHVISFCHRDTPTLYRMLPQTILIEQGSIDAGCEAKRVEEWRERLEKLVSSLGSLSTYTLRPEEYTSLKIVDEISWERAADAGIIESCSTLAEFERLPAEAADALGLCPDDYRVYCWGDGNMSIQAPDASHPEWLGIITRKIEPIL